MSICLALTRYCTIILSCLALFGCAAVHRGAPDDAHFVVLGEQGAVVARVITAAPDCPSLLVDGRSMAMSVRAPQATLALRPTASEPRFSKPTEFPVTTCDAVLPPGARSATVDGQALALPKAEIRRIVVIGDTGCRLKVNADGASGTWQDCNDTSKYPFARVARAAAAWQPDLVVHVGDYEYRENACPASHPGCAGSSWGYGWDAWRDDFFKPGAALLQAAPWVLARGNHESCYRAGQGWWRLLDPRPLAAGRDCNAARDDATGDYSEPYAVPLGAGAQLIVMDTSNTPNKALAPHDVAAQHYRADYRRLEELSQQARYNIGVEHHPILGFFARQGADGRITLLPGNTGLQSVFGELNPLYLPPRINVMLSGHIHAWEQLSFATAHPSQFITGFSGTDEDIVPLPATVPSGVQPAPGAEVAHLSSWVDGFGFMTMEKNGDGRWAVVVFNQDGVAMNHCQIDGSKSVCERAVVK